MVNVAPVPRWRVAGADAVKRRGDGDHRCGRGELGGSRGSSSTPDGRDFAPAAERVGETLRGGCAATVWCRRESAPAPARGSAPAGFSGQIAPRTAVVASWCCVRQLWQGRMWLRSASGITPVVCHARTSARRRWQIAPGRTVRAAKRLRLIVERLRLRRTWS